MYVTTLPLGMNLFGTVCNNASPQDAANSNFRITCKCIDPKTILEYGATFQFQILKQMYRTF